LGSFVEYTAARALRHLICKHSYLLATLVRTRVYIGKVEERSGAEIDHGKAVSSKCNAKKIKDGIVGASAYSLSAKRYE